ncbi:hypothetical protein ACLKA6_017406 [Drosophila palustris]
MNKRSENTTDISKFRIQLLSDKTIVLVEATGYESEIFFPQLKGNHIVLTNVVYGRQPKNQASDTRLGSRPSSMRCNRVGGKHRRLKTATAGLPPDQVASKVKAQKVGPKFELKLISNGNVLLVECNGYESEIFLPLISSRCVALKRVSACELTRFANQKTSRREQQEQYEQPEQILQNGNGNAAALAASLAAQAVGLTKLLVYLPLTENENGERTTPPKEKIKRKPKQQVKAAGDAKMNENRKYRSIYSKTR